MILSMTGYGTGSAQKEDTSVSVEIRTVNHRFLDLHVRLSREYLFLEGEIQQLIRSALDRGRVEVNATIQKRRLLGVPGQFQPCQRLSGSGRQAEGRVQPSGIAGSEDDPESAGSHSEPRGGSAETAGTLSELMNRSVRTALDGVLQMRRQEGEALRADMLSNLGRIEESARHIRELSVNLAGGVSAEAPGTALTASAPGRHRSAAAGSGSRADRGQMRYLGRNRPAGKPYRAVSRR